MKSFLNHVFGKVVPTYFVSAPQESSVHDESKPTLQRIQQTFGHSPDLIIRQIRFGHPNYQLVSTIYIDAMVDKQIVNNFVLKATKTELLDATTKNGSPQAGKAEG
ncbi:spore germination protein [Paenibacillus sp. SYP-B3998]|uniref:Spore germination protein n=1 Tax=Paenibacillus sp. SYP-B3998 TaxID=2678564 RepID=A0A6G3ZWB4_9BACL|nr:spore germination protein [Paenibacillus sp. SYP-B3998]NEW05707.1 spore germination protein [Paenibacillus sp. SYP-B3998]